MQSTEIGAEFLIGVNRWRMLMNQLIAPVCQVKMQEVCGVQYDSVTKTKS